MGMKAFIAKYYNTLESAKKAYFELSPQLQAIQSLIEVGGKYFIIGNSQIEAIERR